MGGSNGYRCAQHRYSYRKEGEVLAKLVMPDTLGLHYSRSAVESGAKHFRTMTSPRSSTGNTFILM